MIHACDSWLMMLYIHDEYCNVTMVMQWHDRPDSFSETFSMFSYTVWSCFYMIKPLPLPGCRSGRSMLQAVSTTDTCS